LTHPPYSSTSGQEAVEFCASVGLVLDPWQALCLEHGLAESPDDRRRWASFEVGLVVPRQNGKGELLMARELVGLFMLKERLVIHSAHEFKTAREGFLRIRDLIMNCDRLRKRVKSIPMGHGDEAVELLSGARLRFMARSKGSGRGFTGDCIVFDEAQILGDDAIRAMLPTLSAVRNPQLWYTGTAGIGQASSHLASVRRRALAGGDAGLTYLEWSVEDEHDPADPEAWRVANPALGIRISPEYVERERAAMSTEGFAAERLGVGDWPSDESFSVIELADWEACASPSEERPAPVCFAADATPERTFGVIATAGRLSDGSLMVELVDHKPGVDWIGDRLVELVERHDPLAVVVDRSGPAGTALGLLERSGVELTIPAAHDVAQAAEGFYDAVTQRQIVHQSDVRLGRAVAGAKQRPIGQAWGWDRRGTSDDISPLVAASFALWGFLKSESAEPGVW
jgi:hypothetical protein